MSWTASRAVAARMTTRIRRGPAWARNRLLRPSVILCYHRVTSLASDPFQLSISPAKFAEHLDVIREFGRPSSLRDLVRASRRGGWLRRGVVLTFDDGYADNLLEMRPLLEKHDIPATVFVTSDAIDSKREFWWDATERLILGPHPLPAELSIATAECPVPLVARGARPLVSALHQSAASAAGALNAPLAGWEAARVQLLFTVHRLIQRHTPEMIATIIASLHHRLGVPSDARPTHRTLTAQELAGLGDGGLVEVGAHTVSHPRLAVLEPVRQARELSTSKRVIEDLIGGPVHSMAYPFGTEADWNTASVRAAIDAGFDSACTLLPGTVWGPHIDRFRLPRLSVQAISGEELSSLLRWFALG